MNRIKSIIAIAAFPLIFLTGCHIHSVFPFYTEETKIPIPTDIEGYWSLIREGATDDISEENPEPWEFSEQEIICYEGETKASLLSEWFQVDDVLFVDIKAGESLSGENEPNGWFEAHRVSVHQAYKVVTNGNEMTFYPLDRDWVRKQLRSGAVKIPHYMAESNSSGRFSPDTSETVLTGNSEELTEFLRYCIAHPEAFGALGGEIYYTFRQVSNDKQDKAFWENVLATGEGTVEEAVRHLSPTTDEMLYWPLHHKMINNPQALDIIVKASVIGNRERVLYAASGVPQLTEEHCEMLFNWQNENPESDSARVIRANLAGVPATPYQILLKLVESGYDAPGINAIKSERLPLLMVTNLIAQLAVSPNWTTKSFVASHHATSPEQLDTLARESLAGQQYEYGVPNVCDTAARNPNTSLATLRMLEQQENIASFYRGLGANPKTSPETLLRIINGNFSANSSELIDAVIQNPNLPNEKILEYASPANKSFHRDLSLNPALPPEVIQTFSTNKMDEIRAAIAANPNTPIDILQRLSKEEGRADLVRSAAMREIERRENSVAEE